jgi:hypothetical protein
MKVMQLVLRGWKQDTLREILLRATLQNIIHLSYFLMTHKNGEINISQIKSNDNYANLFTKSVVNTTFHKYVHGIGMRHFRDLQGFRGGLILS